jgi:hypothetical protein
MRAALVLCVWGLVVLLARAQSPVQTSDLLDAILGKRTFQKDQLTQLDVNKDGVVDVADLVANVRAAFHYPQAYFEVAQSGADEGLGTIFVRILLNEPYTGNLQFTTGGTAVAGVDYFALTGNVYVSGTSVDLPIVLIDNATSEPTKTITLTLQAGTNYDVGATPTHTITLHDNDGAGIAQAYFAEATSQATKQSGTTAVRIYFTKRVTGALGYSIGGTAIAGTHYTALPGTLALNNANSATLPVEILNNHVREAAKTLTLTLSAGAGYEPATPESHTLTISDPAVNFSTNEATEEEGSKTVFANLELPGVFTGTIKYAVGGTAVAGKDFDPLPGTLAVNGARTARIQIVLRDDSVIDPLKTIELTLLPDAAYVLGATNPYTLYITENDSLWFVTAKMGEALLDLRVNLYQRNGVTTGTLVSNGKGVVPNGTWPLAINRNGGWMQIIAGPYPVPMEQAPLEGVTFTRGFVFTADPNKAPYALDLNTNVAGQAQEQVVPQSGGNAFSFNVNGTFTMVKGQTGVNVPPPVFVN